VKASIRTLLNSQVFFQSNPDKPFPSSLLQTLQPTHCWM